MVELRKLFDEVRLVDPSSLRRLAFNGDKLVDTGTLCHEVWKYPQRCVNCVSARALSEGRKQTKIEFIADRAFFVVGEPFDVGGRECVMECILEMNDFLMSSFGDNIFRQKIESVNDKIYKDSLTGVFNRKYYDEVAKGLFCSCVVFIDIDKFKGVNDEYGHGAGDMVLRAVAEEIGKNIRSTDGLIRYGGDEFLLFFTGRYLKDAFVRKMKKIRDDVASIRFAEMPDIRISLSIGAVFASGKLEDLVSEADRQMYAAKRSEGHISVCSGEDDDH